MAEPNKKLVLPKLPVFSESLKGPLPKAEELRALDRVLADWLEKTQFAIRQQFATLSPYAPALNAATKTLLADYELQLADGTLLCDATRRPFTVSLPPPERVANKLFNIKKVDGTTNVVTTSVESPALIDGGNTVILVLQWQSFSVQSDG